MVTAILEIDSLNKIQSHHAAKGNLQQQKTERGLIFESPFMIVDTL